MKQMKRRANKEGSIYYVAKEGRWRGSIMLKGRRRYVSGRTRAEAFRKLTALRLSAERGELPENPERLTVAKFLERWLEVHVRPNVKPRTHQVCAEVCRCDLIPRLGEIPLSKLSPAHIKSMLAAMERDGKAPPTRRLAYSVLCRALNVAVRWKRIGANPAKGVPAPRVERKERRHLSLEEVQRLLDVLDGERLRPLFLLARFLGLRRGELLGLKWEDIDFKRKTVTVRRSRVRVGPEVVESTPKTQESKASLPLPTPSPRRCWHGGGRSARRLKAGLLWEERGYVFTDELGMPLSDEGCTVDGDGFVGRPRSRMLPFMPYATPTPPSSLPRETPCGSSSR